MVNSWLLLSGLGMMLVGFFIPVYYWRTKKIPVKYFGIGAALWLLAITPKILLDLTITPTLYNYLQDYSAAVFVIVVGLYLGLRTGFFESGLTYLIAIKTKLKSLSKKQVYALGIGFGCFEAFIIGFFSFIGILPFVIQPDLINILPTDQAEVLTNLLNQSTLVVPAAIIERISVIVIHVFTTLLVFYAIRADNKKYLWYSIGFKTIVDGIIPTLNVYVGSETISGIYLMELPFIGLGLIALYGIFWMKKIWSEE